MNCTKCKGELDYDNPDAKVDENGKVLTATEINSRQFYVASLAMQKPGWNEQLNFYVCSKCYAELKKEIVGGK